MHLFVQTPNTADGWLGLGSKIWQLIKELLEDASVNGKRRNKNMLIKNIEIYDFLNFTINFQQEKLEILSIEIEKTQQFNHSLKKVITKDV